jgi:hypothetical protein
VQQTNNSKMRTIKYYLPLALHLLLLANMCTGDTASAVGTVGEKLSAIGSVAATKVYGAAKYANTLAKINSALGMAGPAFAALGALVSMFLPEDSTSQQLREGFNEIRNQFARLENKVEEVKITVVEQAAYQNYGQERNGILKLRRAFVDLYESPSPFHRTNMQDKCRHSNPTDILTAIHDMVTNPAHDQNILNIITEQFDREKLKKITTNVMLDIARAQVFEIVCMNVRNSSERPSEADMRRLNDTTRRMISDIVTSLQTADDTISTTFYQNNRLENHMRPLLNTSDHQQQAQIVYNSLSRKYQWLEWSVIVYDDIEVSYEHVVYTRHLSGRGGYQSIFRHATAGYVVVMWALPLSSTQTGWNRFYWGRGGFTLNILGLWVKNTNIFYKFAA